MDGLDRTRGTGRHLPAQRPEFLANRFQLQAHQQFRLAQAGFADPPVVEAGPAQADAAHLQAGQGLGFEFLADDQFGAATADIHHQPSTGNVGDAVRDPQIDQPRLFLTADDLDVVPQHLLGATQESGAVASLAQGVGTDNAQLFGSEMTQTLAETRQTVQSTLLRFLGQAVVVVQTTGQLHHFAQSVQHLHMAVGDPGDNQVETVGTQIDGGDDVGRHGNFPFNPA